MLLLDSAGPRGQAVGGKAAGLFRLRALGVAVPPFAVLPASTFDLLLEPWPAHSTADLDQREQQLAAFQPSPAEQHALQKALAAWGFPARPVVVRSSVVDEDGGTHSFAGLMTSFLNLTTEADVWWAVAQCAASAYSGRARAYRQQRGLPPAARPAVVVQAQVAARTSGVLFSTWPEYPAEMAIHAVWGYGEALVSGAQAPDEFYLSKATGTLSHQVVAPKLTLLVAGPAAGLAARPVDPANQTAPSLSLAGLAELHGVGQRLEKALGGPQDVEFVVDEAGKLWVVQARPVTQPIPELLVFDNANIQESYCGVTTPLTFSFARRAYATVYSQTMRVLGVPAAEVAAHQPLVHQLLALVQGRIYYHINHWYRGLLLLPAFRQNKADMERMMGLLEPVDLVQPPRRGLGHLLRRGPRLVLNLLRLLAAFAALPRTIPAFQTRLAAACHRFYQLPLPELSGPALWAEKQALDRELLDAWTTPIINDFQVMMANGRALRRLRAARAPHPEELLRHYLAADQQLASAQPAHRLLALARQAAACPGLPALLHELPADVHEQVTARYPEIAQAAAEFIAEYGDRTVGELKLETATMRTSPRLFYQYLRNLVTDAPPAPGPSAEVAGGAAAELAALLRPLPQWRRWQLTRSLNQLQTAIRQREALRLERTRLFGMYRALYRAAGVVLTQAGHLTEPAQVFYLTEDEIGAALHGHPAPHPAEPSSAPAAPDVWLAVPPAVPGQSWHEVAAARQIEFAGYREAEVPGRVTVPASPHQAAPPTEDLAVGLLQGTGCFPGQVEGDVLVVRGPEDSLAVSGKIVCALRTDPGWAVLFPACRAVAIERGSSLSHSVILLRELGIPTIINVPGLTRHLRSGQRVHFDGQAGTVRLLPGPAAGAAEATFSTLTPAAHAHV